MKGLLIEFNIRTGRRAGGINPKEDKALLCHGWQDLESIPAKEIRVIEDDRDVSQYEGIEGVTVLHSDEEIEKAIEELVPKKYAIVDETLYQSSLQEKGIKLTELKEKTRDKISEELFKKGVLGIIETKPLKLSEVYG